MKKFTIKVLILCSAYWGTRIIFFTLLSGAINTGLDVAKKQGYNQCKREVANAKSNY